MINEKGIPKIITNDNLGLIKIYIANPTKINPKVIFAKIVFNLSLINLELSLETTKVISS